MSIKFIHCYYGQCQGQCLVGYLSIQFTIFPRLELTQLELTPESVIGKPNHFPCTLIQFNIL